MAGSVIGLDIGSHAIKVTVLRPGKGGRFSLENMGQASLPITSILDGEIHEPEEVANRIKALIKSLKITEKNVATSLSGDAMIIKRIIIPMQSPAELKGNLEREAEQYIPYDLATVSLDGHIVGPSQEHPGQMEVLLVAAKREVVAGYTNVLKQAGLKPVAIDLDLFALLNAFEKVHPEKRGGIALIDIGATLCHLNIINNGISLLSKDEHIGGHRITEELMDMFGCGFEEAEAIKMGAQPPRDQGVVVEIFDRALSNWGAALDRALEQAKAENEHLEIREIFLAGGASRLSGLEDYFQSRFQAQVSRFNPLESLMINPKYFDPNYVQYAGPQMAVSFGLALRRGENL